MKKYYRNSKHRWSSKYLPQDDTVFLHKDCAYNTSKWVEDFSIPEAGFYGNICDQPDINKENSDSKCHYWSNKKVMDMLGMFKD